MPDLPPEIPIIGYPTPHVADRTLTEIWDTLRANQEPQQPGARHPNEREFPSYVFVAQVAIPGTEKWVHRIWVNDRAAEDTYNASESFSGEANAYPIFARSYLARKLTYAPLTKLTALTGLAAIKVTAGGTGYEAAPAVSFTGTGSGAAAIAVVFAGAVVSIIVIAEGAGYDSASLPAVVLTPTSGGTGATAVAIVQPKTCLLVTEKAERMEGDPLDSLYWRVGRVYETLPGPSISKSDPDEDGMALTVTRTRVDLSTISVGETVGAGVWTRTSKQPDTAQVGWKVVTTRPLPGDAITDQDVEPPSGVTISKARTLKEASTITPGIVISTGSHVFTERHSVTALVAWEEVTTHPEAAAHDEGTAIIEERSRPFLFRGRVDVTPDTTLKLLLTYRKAWSEDVPHYTYSWWVNSATKPTITLDTITPETLVVTEGTLLDAVLHDEITVSGVPIPETVPNYTDYVASWIGSDRVIDGSVEQAGVKNRWRVQLVKVNMK